MDKNSPASESKCSTCGHSSSWLTADACGYPCCGRAQCMNCPRCGCKCRFPESVSSDIARLSREAVIRALTQRNPRFALYREQDPAFREGDVTFWTEVIQSVITDSDLYKSGYRAGVEDAANEIDVRYGRSLGHMNLNVEQGRGKNYGCWQDMTYAFKHAATAVRALLTDGEQNEGSK